MGDGTCTKVPTILQLKKGSGYSVEVIAMMTMSIERLDASQAPQKRQHNKRQHKRAPCS